MQGYSAQGIRSYSSVKGLQSSRFQNHNESQSMLSGRQSLASSRAKLTDREYNEAIVQAQQAESIFDRTLKKYKSIRSIKSMLKKRTNSPFVSRRSNRFNGNSEASSNDLNSNDRSLTSNIDNILNQSQAVKTLVPSMFRGGKYVNLPRSQNFRRNIDQIETGTLKDEPIKFPELKPEPLDKKSNRQVITDAEAKTQDVTSAARTNEENKNLLPRTAAAIIDSKRETTRFTVLNKSKINSEEETSPVAKRDTILDNSQLVDKKKKFRGEVNEKPQNRSSDSKLKNQIDQENKSQILDKSNLNNESSVLEDFKMEAKIEPKTEKKPTYTKVHIPKFKGPIDSLITKMEKSLNNIKNFHPDFSKKGFYKKFKVKDTKDPLDKELILLQQENEWYKKYLKDLNQQLSQYINKKFSKKVMVKKTGLGRRKRSNPDIEQKKERQAKLVKRQVETAKRQVKHLSTERIKLSTKLKKYGNPNYLSKLEQKSETLEEAIRLQKEKVNEKIEKEIQLVDTIITNKNTSNVRFKSHFGSRKFSEDDVEIRGTMPKRPERWTKSSRKNIDLLQYESSGLTNTNINKEHPLVKEFNLVVDKIEKLEEKQLENLNVKHDLETKIGYNEQKLNSLMYTCQNYEKNPLTEEQILKHLASSAKKFPKSSPVRKVVKNADLNLDQGSAPDLQTPLRNSASPPKNGQKAAPNSAEYYRKLKETLLHNKKSTKVKMMDEYKRTLIKSQIGEKNLSKNKTKLRETTTKIYMQEKLIKILEEEMNKAKKRKKVMSKLKKLDLSVLNKDASSKPVKEETKVINNITITGEKLDTKFGDNAEKVESVDPKTRGPRINTNISQDSLKGVSRMTPQARNRNKSLKNSISKSGSAHSLAR
ncbi:unnamed protein product [Moneuplotes crassus]|uniref:Uncharacterized protein n=1 Tax=Euplotes crassus TaxID=5936 RepID=A0AAD2D631_EUPCR|nr:unnamed protein product [Moneuplotes crassus]